MNKNKSPEITYALGLASGLNEDYFTKVKASLVKIIESEGFGLKSEKRYILVSAIHIVEDDFDKKSGRVTGYLDYKVYSNSVSDLKQVWEKSLHDRYSTTCQHFIFDMRDNKVIEVLSMCA